MPTTLNLKIEGTKEESIIELLFTKKCLREGERGEEGECGGTRVIMLSPELKDLDGNRLATEHWSVATT